LSNILYVTACTTNERHLFAKQKQPQIKTDGKYSAVSPAAVFALPLFCGAKRRLAKQNAI